MKILINYIKNCFCKHEWELIFDTMVEYKTEDEEGKYRCKTYRCKTCGYSKKYKSN